MPMRRMTGAKSIGEGIANLYNELAALLDETVHVNYEERNGRLYFNLWQAHTWGEYTLYYFPVKFVEALNPKLRRIALSFLHHLMRANGFSTINDEEDTNWVFEMFSQDDDGEDRKRTCGTAQVVAFIQGGQDLQTARQGVSQILLQESAGSH